MTRRAWQEKREQKKSQNTHRNVLKELGKKISVSPRVWTGRFAIPTRREIQNWWSIPRHVILLKPPSESLGMTDFSGISMTVTVIIMTSGKPSLSVTLPGQVYYSHRDTSQPHTPSGLSSIAYFWPPTLPLQILEFKVLAILEDIKILMKEIEQEKRLTNHATQHSISSCTCQSISDEQVKNQSRFTDTETIMFEQTPLSPPQWHHQMRRTKSSLHLKWHLWGEYSGPFFNGWLPAGFENLDFIPNPSTCGVWKYLDLEFQTITHTLPSTSLSLPSYARPSFNSLYKRRRLSPSECPPTSAPATTSAGSRIKLRIST